MPKLIHDAKLLCHQLVSYINSDLSFTPYFLYKIDSFLRFYYKGLKLIRIKDYYQ